MAYTNLDNHPGRSNSQWASGDAHLRPQGKRMEARVSSGVPARTRYGPQPFLILNVVLGRALCYHVLIVAQMWIRRPSPGM